MPSARGYPPVLHSDCTGGVLGKSVNMHEVSHTSHSQQFCQDAKDCPSVLVELDTDLPIVAVRLSWLFSVAIVSVYLPNGKLPDLK